MTIAIPSKLNSNYDSILPLKGVSVILQLAKCFRPFVSGYDQNTTFHSPILQFWPIQKSPHMHIMPIVANKLLCISVIYPSRHGSNKDHTEKSSELLTYWQLGHSCKNGG